jgi:tripartite-type tricarboxylate transporter receptor subunit TctC
MNSVARILAVLVLIHAPGAVAQSYPVKPVRVVVPFAAGGPGDLYARFLGQQLQEQLGQPFVIENRPGAGSIIGTDVVAKAPADGHTLLLMSNTHTINESLMPKKPFVLMRDFAPIAPINASDLLLVVHPSLPVRSVQSLVALARAKPKGLNYASSGNGTPYHLAAELFKSLTRVDMVHVPHKGSSDARTSVMSGQVELMFDAITTMAPIARSGRVRALATTGLTRSTVMGDVPTVAEAGVPGYEATIWLGLMAPVGTPSGTLARLNQEVTRVVSRPEVKNAWRVQGAQPLVLSVSAFDKFLRDDIAKWARVVNASGARSSI